MHFFARFPARQLPTFTFLSRTLGNNYLDASPPLRVLDAILLLFVANGSVLPVTSSPYSSASMRPTTITTPSINFPAPPPLFGSAACPERQPKGGSTPLCHELIIPSRFARSAQIPRGTDVNSPVSVQPCEPYRLLQQCPRSFREFETRIRPPKPPRFVRGFSRRAQKEPQK